MNSRLEVNAALCDLVNGDNIEESAQTVIEFACTLKPGRTWFEATIQGRNDQDVTGATEHGSATIKDDGEKTTSYKIGREPERIGQFKMMRTRTGTLRFYHYWASDPGTQAELGKTQKYSLGFDPKSKKLKYFGAVALVKEYRWHFIWIHIYAFLPIYGKAKARYAGFNIILTNMQ